MIPQLSAYRSLED